MARPEEVSVFRYIRTQIPNPRLSMERNDPPDKPAAFWATNSGGGASELRV